MFVNSSLLCSHELLMAFNAIIQRATEWKVKKMFPTVMFARHTFHDGSS